MLVSGNGARGIKTEVELTMTNGAVLYGEMFLGAELQVLDILNGDAQFLPFEGMGGALSVINKASIAQITQHHNAVVDDSKLVALAS